MTGEVDSARGLPPGGHLCWAYRDRAEYRARASEFIRDGLARGDWIEYVGAGDVASLRAELRDLDGGREALDRDLAGVTPVGEFYAFTGSGDMVDPQPSVERRVRAVEQAVAAGWTGFRAVVDATAVVATSAQRESFARFEYLIDRRMSDLPGPALCAYNAAELGNAAARVLACLHPLTNTGSTPFRLYADHGVDFALAGVLDASYQQLLRHSLEHAVRGHDRELTVDGRLTEFIDHHCLRVLAEHGRGLNVTISVRGARASTRSMIEILNFPTLRASP